MAAMLHKAHKEEERLLRLLICYVAGECTEEERSEVEFYLANDEGARKMLREVRCIWTPTTISSSVDTRAAWQRVRQQLESEDAADQRERRSVRRSIGRKYERPARRGWARPGIRIAAVTSLVAVVLLFVAIAYRQAIPVREFFSPQVEMLAFSTPSGQRSTVRLADGTLVTLGPHTRLDAPGQFRGRIRRVRLNGQAHFEVAKDARHPFVVEMGRASVEVLGTVFSIRAVDQDRSLEVAVVEGAVAFRDPSVLRDSVVLRPRHVAIVRSGSVEVRKNANLAAYTDWKEGRLVFEHATFERVMTDLERWYGLNVELEGDARRINPISVSFTNEPLDEVLNIVSTTLGLSYHRKQRNVSFHPISESGASQ